MSDEAESQEPTMEEILASIRRIISEDDEGEEAASSEEAPVEAEGAPESASEPVDEVEAEEEVMELTDMIVEEPVDEPEAEPVAEPEPEAEPEVEAEDVMELEAAPEPTPEPVIEKVVENDIDFGDPMPMAEPEPEPEVDVLPVEEDGALISGATEVAAAAAFGELASSMITSSGESRTLEGLVGDMLRPMLKDWMDKNLPDLVEQMVREEIERVARRGR